jgi:hypothetical protein
MTEKFKQWIKNVGYYYLRESFKEFLVESLMEPIKYTIYGKDVFLIEIKGHF